MNLNQGLPLIAPRVPPVLDPGFRPAALAVRAFRAAVNASGSEVPLSLAIEQADGSVFHHATEVFAEGRPGAAGNFLHVERLVKFMLWGWGGWRIHVQGSPTLATQLQQHFRETVTGKFDSHIIGEKIFDRAIEVVAASELPPERSATTPLGRHLDGCRIGFD